MTKNNKQKRILENNNKNNIRKHFVHRNFDINELLKDHLESELIELFIFLVGRLSE